MTTARETQMLAAIRDLTVDGVPPSYRELQSHFGFASIGNIYRIIGQLEQAGRVTRSKLPRSLVIVEDAIHPSVLAAASDAALRRTAAHIAAVLAARRGVGVWETVQTFRAIADALLKPRRA